MFEFGQIIIWNETATSNSFNESLRKLLFNIKEKYLLYFSSSLETIDLAKKMNYIVNLFCCCFRFCQKRETFDNHSSSAEALDEAESFLDELELALQAEIQAELDEAALEAFRTNFLAWAEENQQPEQQIVDLVEIPFWERHWHRSKNSVSEKNY